MKADYNKMQECFQNIQETVNKMAAEMENIKEITTNLDKNESWTGKGANEYSKKAKNLSQDFYDCCNKIHEVNQAILNAVNKYKDVDRMVMESTTGSTGDF